MRQGATSGHGETGAKQAPRRHRPEDEPLGRPRTARLPKPRAERATQFMPFAALRGYYDLVRAQERRVEPRHELTEEEARELSTRVVCLRKGDMVRVVYYNVDAYEELTGVLTGVDTTFRTLTVVRRKIAFDDIRSIERVGAV